MKTSSIIFIAKKRSLCNLGRSFRGPFLVLLWPVPGNHAFYIAVFTTVSQRVLNLIQQADSALQFRQKLQYDGDNISNAAASHSGKGKGGAKDGVKRNNS